MPRSTLRSITPDRLDQEPAPPTPAALPGPPISGEAGGVASAPDVDLRIVLFTVAAGSLLVCLQDCPADHRLPRGRPRPSEPLDAGARRLLRTETGLREEYLEQLYSVAVVDGQDWTVVVSYLGLVASVGDSPPTLPGTWSDPTSLPAASETDRMIIDYGALRLRAKLGYTTIAFHLLPPTFTLSELQSTYEAVLGRSLDKRNFRRRVLAADFLTGTELQRRVGSHRPALLYRFRAAHDRETYLTPDWAEGA